MQIAIYCFWGWPDPCATHHAFKRLVIVRMRAEHQNKTRTSAAARLVDEFMLMRAEFYLYSILSIFRLACFTAQAYHFNKSKVDSREVILRLAVRRFCYFLRAHVRSRLSSLYVLNSLLISSCDNKSTSHVKLAWKLPLRVKFSCCSTSSV